MYICQNKKVMRRNYSLLILGVILFTSVVFTACKKEYVYDLPTVTTEKVTGITAHSAIAGGVVVNDQNELVLQKGICYSTKHNPTIADSKFVSYAEETTFSLSMISLQPSTTYYVRAYATVRWPEVSEDGTGYGAEVSFTTNP